MSRFPKMVSAILMVVAVSAVSPVFAQTFLDRQDADSFRMVSYNVHFDDLFDSSNGRAQLQRMIGALDADVYNFQEAFDTSASDVVAMFNTFSPLGGGQAWRAHKGRNQLIISRHDLSLQQTDVPNGSRGIAMAQVDMPDLFFANDMYVLNNHFPCCNNESGRQSEADAISAWIQDAITTGGDFDLAQDTAIAVLGDLNIVNGPNSLNTLINGNGSSPDWDGTSLADSHPFHNATGSDDWTWRNDNSQFDPGVLDYILFTDSVLEMNHGFILNPSQMSAADLQASGLLATDFKLDQTSGTSGEFDHLPLVVDFAPNAVPEPAASVLLLLGFMGVMTRRSRKM